MRCVQRRKAATGNAWVSCGVCDADQPLTVLATDDDWRDQVNAFIDEHYGEHGVWRFRLTNRSRV